MSVVHARQTHKYISREISIEQAQCGARFARPIREITLRTPEVVGESPTRELCARRVDFSDDS